MSTGTESAQMLATSFYQEHVRTISAFPQEDSPDAFNMFTNAETIGHIYQTNALMNLVLSLLPRKVTMQTSAGTQKAAIVSIE
jgi:hypothetical protein